MLDQLAAGARWLRSLDNARLHRAGEPALSSPVLDPAQLLRALHSHRVQFVVVGGAAMTLHGSPRLTRDLDICYERSRANCTSLVRLLVELDAKFREPTAAGESLDESRLARATNIFFMLATRLGDLDLLPVPDGTTGYDDLMADAEQFVIEDIPVWVASRAALERMKRAVDRAVDRDDLRWLLGHDR